MGKKSYIVEIEYQDTVMSKADLCLERLHVYADSKEDAVMLVSDMLHSLYPLRADGSIQAWFYEFADVQTYDLYKKDFLFK